MNARQRVLLASLVLAGLTLVWAAGVLADGKDADKESVVEGNSEFALDLYAQLKGKDGNLFFSPYSISGALAMTYAGARGKTAEEMADVLHFTLGQEKLHPAFARLTGDLQTAGPGIELNIANALWGQRGYKFLETFLDLLKKSYGAGLHEVNFKGETEQARQTINKWVEDQTKNKIKNLIQRGVLDPDILLVLTNAIYFKGDWVKKFDKKLTKDAKFSVKADKTVKAPLMYAKNKFKYKEMESLQVLELPYSGKKMSMVVLLPRKVDGLAGLEAGLSAENLQKWTTGLREKKVKVYLPKFKMTCEFALAQTLSAMGMPTAFSQAAADLSGIDGTDLLFISAVIHKAFVDVNEEGTEAAAATAVPAKAKGRPRPEPVFRADHPFLFLIKDTRSGSILFMGRLVNPES